MLTAWSVVVFCAGARMCVCVCLQTKVKYATLQPVWNETFVFHVTNEDFYISIDVWDSDQLSKYALSRWLGSEVLFGGVDVIVCHSHGRSWLVATCHPS